MNTIIGRGGAHCLSEIRQTWGGGGACPKSLKTPDVNKTRFPRMLLRVLKMYRCEFGDVQK